ncbi:MAG: hypothetical protein ACE367_26565 [Acidimicrobiales bacterium]
MEFTSNDIDSLGDKLAAMDLTDGEREALQTVAAIAGAANDEEVAGFGFRRVPGADFGSLGLKIGPPKGRIIHTGDEIEVTKSGFVVVEGEVT